MDTEPSFDDNLGPHAAAAVAPGWCLRFLSGAVKGRTIVLKPGINVLGSGVECEVMLPGGDVLPRHLVFTVGELVAGMKVGNLQNTPQTGKLQDALRSGKTVIEFMEVAQRIRQDQ